MGYSPIAKQSNLNDVSTTKFSLRYSGSALDGGEMEAEDLGSSLASLGQCLHAANKAINGKDARLSVKIHSNFKNGSFIVDLSVSAWQEIRHFLLSPGWQATKELLALIGIAPDGSVNLIELLKFAKGRVPSEVRKLDDGKTEIRFKGDNKSAPVKISKDEYPSFSLDGERLLVSQDDKEEFLELIALNFESDSWRFKSHWGPIKVRLLDHAFLSQVNNDTLAFSKKDKLRCTLRITEWDTAKGRQYEHEILKVLEVIHSASRLQEDLPLKQP